MLEHMLVLRDTKTERDRHTLNACLTLSDQQLTQTASTSGRALQQVAKARDRAPARRPRRGSGRLLAAVRAMTGAFGLASLPRRAASAWLRMVMSVWVDT